MTPMHIFQDTMADMKWTDIKRHAEEDAIVLLPLGVIEEHGPQLCLGTDIYTAHIYCLSVRRKLAEIGRAAVIAPPFYWGVCQSTGGFIGSFGIRMETAAALVYDIIASLKEFGFTKVFGINAHGDINHAIALMGAFREAGEKLKITACFPFDQQRLVHFGLDGSEAHIYPIKPQEIKVSQAAVWDVHGGDVETATIHGFYPHLVDTELAKKLPDVPLKDDMGNEWLFGGHIRELSPEGYLGSPSSFEAVDVAANVEDYAKRVSEGIVRRLEAVEA